MRSSNSQGGWNESVPDPNPSPAGTPDHSPAIHRRGAGARPPEFRRAVRASFSGATFDQTTHVTAARASFRPLLRGRGQPSGLSLPGLNPYETGGYSRSSLAGLRHPCSSALFEDSKVPGLASSQPGSGNRVRRRSNRIWRSLRLVWIAALWIGCASLSLRAQLPLTNTIRHDFWDVSGTVNALAVSQGKLYVGGEFSYVAPPRGKLLAVDVFTGVPQTGFPEIHGQAIYAMVDDGRGGWYLGGDFHEVGGLTRSNLVHILSDDSVAPDFQPNPDGAVRALALDGDVLYVGGEFGIVASENRRRLAAWDVAGNQLLAWNPETTNSSGSNYIATLAVSDTTVFAGGFFTHLNGQPLRHLAALDKATGLALASWNPDPDGTVLTLAFAENRLFAGGLFNLVKGPDRYEPRDGLAALDAFTGLTLTNWNPAPQGGLVNVVRVDCTTVYVGGSFTNLGGATRYRAGAVDIDSGLATEWNPNFEAVEAAGAASSIQDLALFGNTIFLAGEFSGVDGRFRRDLVSVDATSGRLLAWNPDVNGTASRVAAAGRTVLAGFLAAPGGVERRNLAAFDLLTGQPTDWNPGANGPVLALVAAGNTVFAGGDFTEVQALPRERIAAIDGTTGVIVPGWNPNAGADRQVNALATDGIRLFVGGRFTSVGSIGRGRLAALDLATGDVLANWNPFADAAVFSLAYDQNTLFVGGAFFTVGPQSRPKIAALDPVSGQVRPSWNPGANGDVRALAAADGVVYAGGDFTLLDGLTHNRLAAIDATGGQALPDWNSSADQRINALLPDGTTLYVGGEFTLVNGLSRRGLAAVDARGGLLDWNPGASDANRIRALAAFAQGIAAGGQPNFELAGSTISHSLAMFPLTGSPTLIQPLRNLAVPAGNQAEWTVTVAGLEPLAYQWYAGGIPLSGATEATLVLSNLTANDSGPYTVLVTNLLGSVSAEAMLTVLEPVAIAAQPQSQTGPPGTDVTLSVQAAGNPAPLYQWRLNGVNIPGAVFPTLTRTNAQPGDGGSYQVVVGNSVNAVISDVAHVLITGPGLDLPLSDNRPQPGSTNSITGLSGVGTGSNLDATRESNEILHAGKLGGASVWLSWVAPTDGIAVFKTRGSGFDTLLGIYSLTNQTNLVLEASDEDRGGFLTSQAAFNAVAGTEYFIAIDGLAGARGDVVFSWDLDTATSPFPRILEDPRSVSVAFGDKDKATFSVLVSRPSTNRFQWFFGCLELAGETNDTLVVSNVTTRNVGAYRVLVMNDSERVVESLSAQLEIGPAPNLLSFDKLEDALARVHGVSAASFPGGTAGSAGSVPEGVFLVSFGTIVSQTFNTSDYKTSLGETNHCAVIGGASAWLPFQTETNAVVEVDTIGSSFDTVLAVYHETNLVNLSSALIGCDNNGAPDGIRSRLHFPATAGLLYLAVVDGVNGAKGPARIGWRLGLAPVLAPPDPASSNLLVAPGGNLTLHVTVVSALPSPGFQWSWNGQSIAGATNDVWVLHDYQPAQAGVYSVVVSNFAGAVPQEIAVVQTEILLQFRNAGLTAEGRFHYQVLGMPGRGFVLQTSSNLLDWTSISTNQLPTDAEPFDITDEETPRIERRFYRLQAWP
jgi:Immunoglobulin I-set domain/Immunoglobulin domain